MATQSNDVALKGAPEDRRIAADILLALRAHGRFMALDAPIRVSLESLLPYINREGGTYEATRVRNVLAKNDGVFGLEEVDEAIIVSTTREGHAPAYHDLDLTHSFQNRLMTPKPKPETPPQPVRERPRVDPSWATIDRLLSPADLEADDSEFDEFLAEEGDIAIEPVAQPIDLEIDELVAIALVEELGTTDVASSRIFRGSSALQPRFTDVEDIEMAIAVGDRLRADSRIANFGEQWMLEERVPRFSRGDLRRLREYIQEQEQPLTDDVLVQDVLGGRPGTADFDLLRFAVNFRLSKEHREFDFVGTHNQRFWSTNSLPQIGTTRRKPNEIGTDYRFLVDESASVQSRTATSADHVLTFYEHHLGLLPFDNDMIQLLPQPLLPNQRSAVLTFECPQSYTTYLVELRYPTPNRGGFILGLDDFYNENLIPGAMLTVEATENDGHYLVRYIQAGAQSARLLELEDRRQRYVFRPTSYACGVIDDFVLSESRFPHLAAEKPLDEKARRRPETVIAATFERLGQKSDGPGFVATFTDLLATVNIERPFSDHFLRSVLDGDETGAFARDPDGHDAYTYVPGTGS